MTLKSHECCLNAYICNVVVLNIQPENPRNPGSTHEVRENVAALSIVRHFKTDLKMLIHGQPHGDAHQGKLHKGASKIYQAALRSENISIVFWAILKNVEQIR